MPCGSRRLPASYTRPRSAVGTLAQPDTPDHEQDADDLKRTQRLIQEPRQPGGCKLKTAPVRPVVAARPAEYVCSEDLFY